MLVCSGSVYTGKKMRMRFVRALQNTCMHVSSSRCDWIGTVLFLPGYLTRRRAKYTGRKKRLKHHRVRKHQYNSGIVNMKETASSTATPLLAEETVPLPRFHRVRTPMLFRSSRSCEVAKPASSSSPQSPSSTPAIGGIASMPVVA